MVLSALLWERHCGPLSLFTDSTFFSFLKEAGLLGLWSGGTDTITIDTIPSSVDQKVFWAAAKLFALQKAEAPIAMVDNDLFVWKDLSPFLKDDAITVLHREELWDCYVPKEELGTPPGYRFDPDWDWEEKPCNTAFAFFPEESFKKRYTEAAIGFMAGNPGKDAVRSSQMVFAEQRILSMCAKRDNVSVITLVEDPFDEQNNLFTHLWGAKDLTKENRLERQRLLDSIMARISELNEGYHQRIKELYLLD